MYWITPYPRTFWTTWDLKLDQITSLNIRGLVRTYQYNTNKNAYKSWKINESWLENAYYIL
jgi:hypothetical protein